MDFDLVAHTHLLVIAGSRAYDLHRPDSDIDVKGIAVPPARYYHGFLGKFEQADKAEQLTPFLDDLDEAERAVVARSKLEGSVFELRKLVRLATDANPNIFDLLFCRDEEIRRITPIGARLREHRDLFVTAKAKHTFTGYATAQLKRIETHRRWLLSPPGEEPLRPDYGLPERTLIPANQLAAAWAAVQKKLDQWEIDWGALDDSERIHIQQQLADYLSEIGVIAEERWKHAARVIGYDENFVLLLDRERRYSSARTEWQQHRDWEQRRNPDRAALEAEHGYDTKHGAHLFRLLRMGREILETGRVNVWRGGIDADEIRSIRDGGWPYDKLVEWAKAENEALDALYARGAYVVPKTPDRARIDALCVELVEAALAGGGSVSVDAARRSGHDPSGGPR